MMMGPRINSTIPKVAIPPRVEKIPEGGASGYPVPPALVSGDYKS